MKLRFLVCCLISCCLSAGCVSQAVREIATIKPGSYFQKQFQVVLSERRSAWWLALDFPADGESLGQAAEVSARITNLSSNGLTVVYFQERMREIGPGQSALVWRGTLPQKPRLLRMMGCTSLEKMNFQLELEFSPELKTTKAFWLVAVHSD